MTSLKLLRKLAISAALAVPLAMLPSAQAHAGIFIQIGIAPPPLPVYAQPPLPGEGYLWTPGYWAYGDAGYYWVPGVWVEAPQPGFLWTPAYWGWEGGFYRFHGGYWGPHVGYYGGINYGFGYGGIGFFGGEWRGGRFAYNGAVSNFGGVHVTNVYVDRTVIVHNTIVNNNHVSFNGPGGIDHHASPEETRFSAEHHIEPTGMQQQHFQAASQDRSQLASINHGRPGTPAAASPTAYHQVAQQHIQSQPISTTDRSAGKSFTPAGNGHEGSGAPAPRVSEAPHPNPTPAEGSHTETVRPNYPGGNESHTEPVRPNNPPATNEIHNTAPKAPPAPAPRANTPPPPKAAPAKNPPHEEGHPKGR
jgi:hypothetical protein